MITGGKKGLGGVLAIFSGCHNKRPRLGVLNNRKWLSHRSGDWEVQDQSADWLVFWQGLSSWLADTCLLDMFSHGGETQKARMNSLVSFKNTILLDQAPEFLSYLILITSLLHHTAILHRFQPMHFRGTQSVEGQNIQSPNQSILWHLEFREKLVWHMVGTWVFVEWFYLCCLYNTQHNLLCMWHV